MAAIIGTMHAKVLIQIADNEPIEVGTMEIELTPKQQPVTRGLEVNVGSSVKLDTKTIEKNVTDRLNRHFGM